MHIEIIGEIRTVETIATGNGIREAEAHWYEAAGIGKREFKVKRFLD